MRPARLIATLVLALALVAPVTATSTPQSPLLEAVAYVRPDAEFYDRNLDLTDWSELKRLHAGGGITSDSPIGERQRLLLDIARSEAVRTPLGLDRLQAWKEAWGWDNTDLEWEARVGHGSAVLRFGDHWDATPFGVALKARGYRATDIKGGVRYAPGSDGLELPLRIALERLFGGIDTFGDTLKARAVIDVSQDGRTVIVRWGGPSRSLNGAARTDPEAVASSPLGRAAVALGRPVVATLIDGRMGCSADGRSNQLMSEEAAILARSVAPLHPYEALGVAYSRSEPTVPPIGRIVFVYPNAEQAREDLAGRRLLIDEGYPWPDSPRAGRYSDIAFGLMDIRAQGRDLVIDVAPVNGIPGNLFLSLGRGASLAMCGPVPTP
jgi:hypothetical protein